MLMPFGYEKKPVPYKNYKAEKFEKNKQKVLTLLKGVGQLSLKDEDKKKLIQEIKKIVENF